MFPSLIFLSTIFVQLTAGLSEQRGLGTHTISLTRSAPDQPLGGGPVDYDRIEAHLDALEAKYSNVLHKRGKARRDGHKRAKGSAALTLVENGSAWAAPATFGGAPVSFILDTGETSGPENQEYKPKLILPSVPQLSATVSFLSRCMIHAKARLHEGRRPTLALTTVSPAL